jgi:hypothetical protein
MAGRRPKESTLASTPSRLAPAFAVFVALQASPALGETPVIIACDGALVTSSTGTKDGVDYYRITGNNFQEWDNTKSVWQDNICARKNYSCSLGAKTYYAEGTYVSDAKQHVKHTLSIDRTSGKVEEYWIVKSGESMFFDGACKPSADPSLITSPTKF